MNTVNVIEISGDDGLITSLKSFPETFEGNNQAESLFRTICEETTDMSVEEISISIDKGYADVPGGGTVQLVHST